MSNGVNNKAFDLMTTAADKTAVDIFPHEKKEVSTKNIHNALMAAGMSPAYGNIADVADATLYALEGEFGEASWSMGAAIPVIGQMVTGKRALKIAKEAGEEMVTLYRGIPEWFPGKMVKEGNFVGGGSRNPNKLYTTLYKRNAETYSRVHRLRRGIPDPSKTTILEFEVPSSYIKKYGKRKSPSIQITFDKGIPKEFLKKVHK